MSDPEIQWFPTKRSGLFSERPTFNILELDYSKLEERLMAIMASELVLGILRQLKSQLPSVIRNTPHSCLTDEHCCALHTAHRAAAEKVEQLIQAQIDKVQRSKFPIIKDATDFERLTELIQHFGIPSSTGVFHRDNENREAPKGWQEITVGGAHFYFDEEERFVRVDHLEPKLAFEWKRRERE